MLYIVLYQTGPGPAPSPGACQEKIKKKFHANRKKKFSWHANCPKKNKKKSEKKVDRTKKSLILSLMNLINSLPTNAAAEYANLTDADRADLHAWFDMVNTINDEVEAAWDRLAVLVDSGAL